MISDKLIKEYQDLVKKEQGKEISFEEASEQANRLVGLVDIFYNMAVLDLKRHNRLKDEPDGFYLEEDGKKYSCLICSRPISGKTGWWDKWGQKCLDCLSNIKKGVIPPEVCKDRDIWFGAWKLKSEYNIKSQTVRRFIREGKLKVRDLKDEQGDVYYSVFLIKENEKFLSTL